jgi:hypothetical protein
MSLKRKAAAIGIGEVRPFRDPGGSIQPNPGPFPKGNGNRYEM